MNASRSEGTEQEMGRFMSMGILKDDDAVYLGWKEEE